MSSLQSSGVKSDIFTFLLLFNQQYKTQRLFIIAVDKEMLQILTFKKLKPANVFARKTDRNDSSVIKVVFFFIFF